MPLPTHVSWGWWRAAWEAQQRVPPWEGDGSTGTRVGTPSAPSSGTQGGGGTELGASPGWLLLGCRQSCHEFWVRGSAIPNLPAQRLILSCALGAKQIVLINLKDTTCPNLPKKSHRQKHLQYGHEVYAGCYKLHWSGHSVVLKQPGFLQSSARFSPQHRKKSVWWGHSTHRAVGLAAALSCERGQASPCATCLPRTNRHPSQSDSCNAPASPQQTQSKVGISRMTLHCKLNEKEELMEEQRDSTTWDMACFCGKIQFEPNTGCESSSFLKSYFQTKDLFVN